MICCSPRRGPSSLCGGSRRRTDCARCKDGKVEYLAGEEPCFRVAPPGFFLRPDYKATDHTRRPTVEVDLWTIEPEGYDPDASF